MKKIVIVFLACTVLLMVGGVVLSLKGRGSHRDGKPPVVKSPERTPKPRQGRARTGSLMDIVNDMNDASGAAEPVDE